MDDKIELTVDGLIENIDRLQEEKERLRVVLDEALRHLEIGASFTELLADLDWDEVVLVHEVASLYYTKGVEEVDLPDMVVRYMARRLKELQPEVAVSAD